MSLRVYRTCLGGKTCFSPLESGADAVEEVIHEVQVISVVKGRKVGVVIVGATWDWWIVGVSELMSLSVEEVKTNDKQVSCEWITLFHTIEEREGWCGSVRG